MGFDAGGLARVPRLRWGFLIRTRQIGLSSRAAGLARPVAVVLSPPSAGITPAARVDTQEVGQRSSTSRTARFHGAFSNAEDVGGLVDRHGIHIHEDKRRPLSLREGGERLLDIKLHLEGGVAITWVRQLNLGQLTRRLAPPEPVQAGVDNDAVQPGRDCGITPVCVGAPEGRQERVLHGIRSQLGVAARAQRDRPHAVLVAPEHLTEGVRMSLEMGPNERAIIQRADVIERWAHTVRLGPLRSR